MPPRKRRGPTQIAVERELDGLPIAPDPVLRALAVSLARQFDAEPYPAVSKELRAIMGQLRAVQGDSRQAAAANRIRLAASGGATVGDTA